MGRSTILEVERAKGAEASLQASNRGPMHASQSKNNVTTP